MTNDELQEVFERDPELHDWTRRTFLKRTGALVVMSPPPAACRVSNSLGQQDVGPIRV